MFGDVGNAVALRLAAIGLLLSVSVSLPCGCRGGPGMTEADSGRVAIGSIEWETDVDRARERARREGKPLWFHFGENPG